MNKKGLLKSVQNKWESFTKEEKITIVIFGLIFIVVLISAANAVFGPKLTYLSITEPVNLENSKIDEIYYKEYSVDNSTKEINIKGITENGANVKAYVVYESGDYFNLSDEFKKYSTTDDPGSISTIKSIGRQFDAQVNKIGVFELNNIPISSTEYSDTWIYITANIPGKHENVEEIIIIHNHPNSNVNTDNSDVTITISFPYTWGGWVNDDPVQNSGEQTINLGSVNNVSGYIENRAIWEGKEESTKVPIKITIKKGDKIIFTKSSTGTVFFDVNITN